MSPLTLAAAQIEEHLATLNTNKTTCACCNVWKYENFTEFNTHKELSVIVGKLRRLTKTST